MRGLTYIWVRTVNRNLVVNLISFPLRGGKIVVSFGLELPCGCLSGANAFLFHLVCLSGPLVGFCFPADSRRA